MNSISDIFSKIEENITGKEVSISSLLEAVHERGFGFILFIFAVPMALPLPVPPGVNIILASPLILLTAQQALGRHTIWLPQFMLKKTIKSDSLRSIIKSSLPWFNKLEFLVKPRFEFITSGIFSNMIGIFGFIMALTICIPLPLTNTVPSLGIALMALGVIMRDGLAVILGAIIGMLWVTILLMIVVFLGTEGIDIVKDVIKTYL